MRSATSCRPHAQQRDMLRAHGPCVQLILSDGGGRGRSGGEGGGREHGNGDDKLAGWLEAVCAGMGETAND
jgi:hypothetical protein